MTETYFERPYVVEVGHAEATFSLTSTQPSVIVAWTFHRAFHTHEDAAAYAERTSEDYEFVRIRKKEAEGDFITSQR